MPDLDYAKVTGRFALTVGDTADLGEDPDTVWCDEGIIRITPLNTYTKVAGGSPVPFTAGHAVIECTIDSDGYLTYNGQRQVYVVDLTSPKVNPQIGAGLATHEVQFLEVKAQGTPVEFAKIQVRFTALGADGDGENDITLVAPVPSGEATPIFRGQQGISIESLAVDAGDLVVTLDDGTEVNAGALPVGPGGSDPGVAAYLADDGSDTAAAARELLAADIPDAGTLVGGALSNTIDDGVTGRVEGRLKALSRWHRVLGDRPATAKIVMSGDSTTNGALFMHNALKLNTGKGGPLSGMATANILNHGNTGFRLLDYLNHANGVGGAPVPAQPWSATLAAAPDLIVASWLINDLRDGTCTKAAAKTRLEAFIALVRTGLPNADLVLRIPNPLTSTVVGTDYYTSGATAASVTTAIREIYLEMRDRYDHVHVLDSAPVFGPLAQVTHPYMTDQLHPNNGGNWLLGHHIACSIGLPQFEQVPLAPRGRYLRKGQVVTVTAGQLHIQAMEGTVGNLALPVINSQKWIVDQSSEIYTKSGSVSLSDATKSVTSTETLVVTKPTGGGFDWTTFAAVGDIVELRGTHPEEGVRESWYRAFVDPPSMATMTGASVDVTVPGAKPTSSTTPTGVIAAPSSGLTAGLIWSAHVTAADTVQIRFFNYSAGTVNYGTDYWYFWLSR